MAYLKEIAQLNSQCFSFSDTYSTQAAIGTAIQAGLSTMVLKEGEEVVAYLISKDCGEYLEIHRIGVSPSAQGKGYGIKMIKKLLKKADRLEKPVYTYVSRSNLVSINAHMRAGFRIYDIGPDWVYIQYNVRG